MFDSVRNVFLKQILILIFGSVEARDEGLKTVNPK